MDIILQGQHRGEDAVESFTRVLKLFKERYGIHAYREIHLSLILIDEQGDEVELVDSKSNEAYRTFEVYRNEFEFRGQQGVPFLKLVVDNTK